MRYADYTIRRCPITGRIKPTKAQRRKARKLRLKSEAPYETILICACVLAVLAIWHEAAGAGLLTMQPAEAWAALRGSL